MSAALYAIAGWLIFGALACVAFIGKERKPITPGSAVLGVIIVSFEATVLILAARHLR